MRGHRALNWDFVSLDQSLLSELEIGLVLFSGLKLLITSRLLSIHGIHLVSLFVNGILRQGLSVKILKRGFLPFLIKLLQEEGTEFEQVCYDIILILLVRIYKAFLEEVIA